MSKHSSDITGDWGSLTWEKVPFIRQSYKYIFINSLQCAVHKIGGRNVTSAHIHMQEPQLADTFGKWVSDYDHAKIKTISCVCTTWSTTWGAQYKSMPNRMINRTQALYPITWRVFRSLGTLAIYGLTPRTLQPADLLLKILGTEVSTSRNCQDYRILYYGIPQFALHKT